MTLSKFVGLLFIISSCIPWFGFATLDSQPFPVLFSCLFLLLSWSKIKSLRINFNSIKILMILSALGILGGSFYNFEFDFLFIRAIFNYIGFVILMMGFIIFFKIYGFPLNLLVLINILWILASLIQIYWPDFFSSFVAHRTDESRGLTSLAPEPTFFAIYLFFIGWIYLIYFNYKLSICLFMLVILNILSIIFLAKSSMVLLFLSIAIIIYFVAFKKYKYLSFITTLIFLGLFFLGNLNFDDSRLSYFISNFFADPVDFFAKDESANSRLSNIILPIHGMIYNYLIPGGQHSFGDIANQIVDLYGDYFFYSIGDIKIMSWMGSLVYELGVFGLLFIYTLYRLSLKKSNKRLWELALLLILVFSAIPLAFPLIPLIFVLFSYNINIKSTQPQ